MLTKLDYCDTVYYPLPEFQLKRLQRVQLVAASFVLNRYVNDINDIVKIGWLPVRQRRDFHVLKLVHKALHSPQLAVLRTTTGADPGFLLGGGAPLRNSVTDW